MMSFVFITEKNKAVIIDGGQATDKECTPEFVWNEPGVELEPNIFGTMRTREWMQELCVKHHYVTKEGTQEIELY